MNKKNKSLDFLEGKRDKLSEVLTEILEGPAFTGSGLKGSAFVLPMESSEEKMNTVFHIINNTAIKKHLPVAAFSMGMSREEWVNHMICLHSGISEDKLIGGKLDDQDWQKMINCMGVLTEAPIYIDDSKNVSAAELLEKGSHLKGEKGLELILVDNFQLLISDGIADSMDERNKKMNEMEEVAQKLNVPVVLFD